MDNVPNFVVPTLSSLYSAPYDEGMTKWRELGAVDKAKNMVNLLGGRAQTIVSALEVGCGTGAVLHELARHRPAWQLTGIEVGQVCATSATESSTGVNLSRYDGRQIPFDDRSFDLVYATHVLEHVLDERGFLAEMRRVSSNLVYVEVPCELNIIASRRKLQQSLSIGHINAYSMNSFLLTLETSGLRIIAFDVFDHSLTVHNFHSSKPIAIMKKILRKGILSLNRQLAAKTFTYHCGALCTKDKLMVI